MNSIEKASTSDIEALLDIQVSAFSTDQKLCGSGPPGYDDHEYQLKAMKRYSYYVIKHKSDVVGRVLLFSGAGQPQAIKAFCSTNSSRSGDWYICPRFSFGDSSPRNRYRAGNTNIQHCRTAVLREKWLPKSKVDRLWF